MNICLEGHPALCTRECNPQRLILVCTIRTTFFLLQVGSGKSSLLEALLGEILPMQRDGRGGNALEKGPCLHGSIAYCSQVPWIVSGTLRVSHHFLTFTNIQLGSAPEHTWLMLIQKDTLIESIPPKGHPALKIHCQLSHCLV